MDNIPTRQQNPGDLKDPKTGQIRTFATPAEGKAALYNDLTAKMTGTSTTGIGPSSSLIDFAKVYAPKGDNNDPIQYAANLANKLKVSPDTKIGTLTGRIDDFASAVAANEGYHGVMASSSPQQSTTPPQAQAASPSAPQPEQSFGQKALGAAGAVGDFFFPVVKDLANDVTGNNQKTALQQVGDAGISALGFIPGLGEARGLMGAGKLAAAGLGTGYAADVASNLSAGKTNAGDVLKPGFGTFTGGVLGAGGAALAGSGESAATRMINSLIKPLKKDFSYGKNPGRAVAAEGIVANNLEDLGTKISQRRKAVGEAIGTFGSSVDKKVKIGLVKTLTPINDALKQAAEQNNQAVFTRLQKVKQALTDTMGIGVDANGETAITSLGKRRLTANSYTQAQKFKQLIGDMTQWTGNPSDDKIVNAALQDVWREVSTAQKDAVGGIKGVGAELRAKLEKLNERYGDLTSAEIATKYRDVIHGRQNIISMADKVFGALGGLGGLTAGGLAPGVVTGALAGGAVHLAGTPGVKTRVARALAGGGAKSVAGQSGLARVRGLVSRTLKKGAKTGALIGASQQQPTP